MDCSSYRSESPRSPPSSSTGPKAGGWRARFAKVKDYVASNEVSKSAYAAVSNRVTAYRTGVDPVTGEKRQTWEEWARERRQRRKEEQRGTEKLALFPGWAVRRYTDDGVLMQHDDIQQFKVDIFVSGFASSLRTPDQATRSQKTFMRLARGFSALPKLPPPPQSVLGCSGTVSPLMQSPNPSTDDLTEELAKMGVVLPPRPDEITDEFENEILYSSTKPKVRATRESRVVDYGLNDPPSGAPTPTATSQPPLPSRSPIITTQAPSPVTSPVRNARVNTTGSVSSGLSVNSPRSNTDVGSIKPDMDVGILRQLHANLDARLQPFWSSKLDNREVQIELYARPPDSSSSTAQDPAPLAVALVRTDAQGYFSHRFSLSFEELCMHDQSLHIAFGNHKEEPTFVAHAKLLPFASNSESTGAGRTRGVELGNDEIRAQTELPLDSARIRLISDIDDTVKISEVLMGVKAIFHNVFVRHLGEVVVLGMPELYSMLAARGVKFHYVSNGPFELLPVLMDFFRIAGLPRGSVKLKSYGGRSLFQGLWGESAADRKRGNVVEVLDSFPESKFILVGDTGEQDLELYSVLAQERPTQIIALFLRDVTPPTPPPTAPPSPALKPVENNAIKKEGSMSSLRSIGGLKGVRGDAPRILIPQRSQDTIRLGRGSRPGTPTRFATRSVTDPSSAVTSPSSTVASLPSTVTSPSSTATSLPSTVTSPSSKVTSLPSTITNPSASYQVYSPRSRGSSSSYFDSPWSKPATHTSFGQFLLPQSPSFDPAGEVVSAAATAGTGHNPEVVSVTRAGILARKEALRTRIEAARARLPPGVILKVFREPSECEGEALRVINRR